MMPIPESVQAWEELGELRIERRHDLLDTLRSNAELVRELVPDLVGLSLSAVRHDLTFTLVATDEVTATLDGAQYLQSGPCLEVAEIKDAREFDQEQLFDEERWRLFAAAAAAVGVVTTLTFPILRGEEVTGSVNLYASAADAFHGHHEAIASIFGAWAPGAVRNADLSFATRREAERAPARLRASMHVQVAIGILVARGRIDSHTAFKQLLDAAERAGVSVERLAEALTTGTEIDDGEPPR